MKRTFKTVTLSALAVGLVAGTLSAGERPSVWDPVKQYAKDALRNSEGIVAGVCASSLYLAARATNGLNYIAHKPSLLVASVAGIMGAYYVAKQYQPAWKSIKEAQKLIADLTHQDSWLFWAVPYSHRIAVNPYEYLQVSYQAGYQQSLQQVTIGLAQSSKSTRVNGALDMRVIRETIGHYLHKCTIALSVLEKHCTVEPSLVQIHTAQSHQERLQRVEDTIADLTRAVEATTYIEKVKRYMLPSAAAAQAYARLAGIQLILQHMLESMAA